MTTQSFASDMEYDQSTTANTARPSDNHKHRPTLPPISSMNELFASKSWPPPSTTLSLANSLPFNSTTDTSNPSYHGSSPTNVYYQANSDKLPISPAADGGSRLTGYFDNHRQQRQQQPFSPSLPSPQQPQNQGCLSPSSPPMYTEHNLSTSPRYVYPSTSMPLSTSTFINHHNHHQQQPNTQYGSIQPSFNTNANSNTIPNIPIHPVNAASVSAPASSALLPISILQIIGRDIDQVINQCNTLSDNMHQKRASINEIEDYFSDSNLMGPWLDDMVGKANEILNALLRIRKHQIAAEQARMHRITSPTAAPAIGASSSYNGSQRQHGQLRYSTNGSDNLLSPNGSGSASYIQQESDRWSSLNLASSSGGFLTLTSSLRKRGKRPGFQGRCHSCNISETPEWRRGPNGARTLCNACGLHYAKLNKKKNKQQQEQASNGSNGSSNNNTNRSENINMMEEDDNISMS